MEYVQLLEDDQIESIYLIIERDYINPTIKSTIKEIKNTKEWKSIEEPIKVKVDKINKEIESLNKSLNVEDYENFNLITQNKIDEIIESKLNYNLSNWSIENQIRKDIEATLRLTQVGDIKDIIESVLPLINVNKYITISNTED